uniref:Ribosomal protein L29 n=1 Tax=Neogoniolithon spectabile TaxID=231755 RepID=A0A3G3MGS0_9FLOR|nr:ribosomal protein L29 [Neogoniolithon spectabile]AYR06029.1 ribosomal protein L29 [Neogoniolithon spectabile]
MIFMKIIKMKEIRQLNDKQIREYIDKIKQELLKLRFQQATKKKPKDTSF